jgi:hypothetical protein
VLDLHKSNDVSDPMLKLFPLPIVPVITEPFPVDEILLNKHVIIVKLLPEAIFKSEGSIIKITIKKKKKNKKIKKKRN